jgi:hypothetical protein
MESYSASRFPSLRAIRSRSFLRLKAVKALDAKAELSKDGTLNEFYDPEGIRMQVTFRGQTPGAPSQK